MMIKSLITILITLIMISSVAAQDNSSSDKVYISMEEAISRALSQNSQIKASEFSMRKANWDKKHAWTLLFPRLGFNTRYTKIDKQSFEERDFFRQNIRLFFPSLPPNFEVPQSSYRESYYTSFDVSMPVFNGAIFNGLFIANAAEDASIQINESAQKNIVFLVTSSYLNVLKLIDVLQIQEEYLKLSKLNYDKAERMHEAGRYSKAEVLRWNVELQQQKSIVVNSQSQLRSAISILKRGVNISMQNDVEIENRIPDALKNESAKLSLMKDDQILNLIQLDDEKLIEVNAALAAAKSNEEISKHLYHNSYSSYLPNINLTYSHAWRENNTIDLDDYSPKTLMVNFSMPLFTSFQNFTSVKSLYYEYKSNQENFNHQLQNTRLLLTETVNKIINLKTQKELSEVNVKFNEKNYSIIEQQKEKGLVSNLDFIDAKLNLQNSKLENISTNYDFISAMVELYYLLGKLDTVIEEF
jgi:outer membrane protein